MKRVLMVAFHFPPLAGSSGIQRTLRFVQQLPALGWEPVVLTADPRAYERTSPDLLRDVPAGIEVCRAFALDTARHLAVAGRYPAFLARPDRWRTWKIGAVAAGLRLLKRLECDAIWSTYPIATAHSIGASLHRRTGIPWVADFRDPMAQEGYPRDPATWQMYSAIEQTALREAARAVFVTPGAARVYRERYPWLPAERVAVIENGFDEESFAGLRDGESSAAPPHRLTLVHSGVVYTSERDPTQLMQALRLLRDAGTIGPADFLLRFRASANEAVIDALARAAGVRELIEFQPAIPYREALDEMLGADGLLLMQAANCNEQVPAKAYEYLRAGRPIVALTDPAGDTAQVLRGAGVTSLAPLDAAGPIAELLEAFVRRDRSHTWAGLPERVARLSRRARAAELVQLLDAVAAPHDSGVRHPVATP